MSSDLRTEGYLLRAVSFRESDVVVTLFSRDVGKVSALFRGGRASKKRAGGALEPFHTAVFEMAEQRGELWAFKTAEIVKVRGKLTRDLERLEQAGTLLRALRALAPARTPEPQAYETITTLLDAFDASDYASSAVFGAGVMQLLADFGYALELTRCVSCGTMRPEERTAVLEAVSGGVVCGSCRLHLPANARLVRLSAPFIRVLTAALSLEARIEAISTTTLQEEVPALLRIGEFALAAHGNMDEHK